MIVDTQIKNVFLKSKGNPEVIDFFYILVLVF